MAGEIACRGRPRRLRAGDLRLPAHLFVGFASLLAIVWRRQETARGISLLSNRDPFLLPDGRRWRGAPDEGLPSR